MGIITEEIWTNYVGFYDDEVPEGEQPEPLVPFPPNHTRLEILAQATLDNLGVLKDYDSLSDECKLTYQYALIEQMQTEAIVIQYGINSPLVLKYVATGDFMYTQDRDLKNVVSKSAYKLLKSLPCEILDTRTYLVGC